MTSAAPGVKCSDLVCSIDANLTKLTYRQTLWLGRGLVDIQAGTLYPLLHRLESDKLIRCKWDSTTGRRRKWYELNEAGRKRLSAQAREWHEYAECIRSLLAPVTDAVPRPA